MVNSNLERKAVERYLADGTMSGLSPEAMARACDGVVRAEINVSAVSAVRLGRSFVQQARTSGGILYLTALRAYGWTLRFADRYEEAEQAYLKARALAGADAMARARIDRILIDIYMYLGKPEEAKRRAHLSLNTFRKLKADDEAAKTRANYANVLHRQDRHRQASRLYQQAADHFQRRGNKPAAALCWSNLANTSVQLFDFAEAARLYTKAREIFLEHDQHLFATDCLYGLAWLHMLEGDFHVALHELEKCETVYLRVNQERKRLLCQLDRAEVYLALNLIVDALKAAEQSGRVARKLGLAYESAKAELFRGKALAALGRLAAARRALERAEAGFRQERNRGFEAAAQMALAQLQRPGRQRLKGIRAVRKRFALAQLPLWAAICDLNIVSDWPDEKSALRRLTSNKAVSTVPHLAAQRHTILGDRLAQKNKLKTAISHWTVAADILDAVRAKLPPLEMRSSFFSTRTEPHRNLIQAVYRHNPLEAAVWSERYKTVGLWSTSSDFFMSNPTRRRIKESLADLAQYVTAVSRNISNSEGQRSAGLMSPAPLRQLHREIRHGLALLEQRSSQNGTGGDIGNLIRKSSHTLPIVQFHVGETDILAFIHQDGSSRAWRYADGCQILSEMVARWRFLVECSPSPGKRTRPADIREERQILARIAGWLLPPLEIAGRADRLLVIPEGQLSSLPWMAMPLNGHVLGERHQLTFAPSLRHHLHSRQHTTRSNKIRIFVGETSGLPHLRREVDAVSSRLGLRESDIYNPSTRKDWPDRSKARIWHYAGHAHLRADNPFYSSLMLSDGPLFAADFRLKRNTVNLVTLAACRTGQQTNLPGEEATGLVRSLLEMGAANVVASNWAISDLSTSMWTDLFYRYYMSGQTPSQAVREASLATREVYPLACHWGSFTVHGAG